MRNDSISAGPPAGRHDVEQFLHDEFLESVPSGYDREALIAANSDLSPSLITFDNTVFGAAQTITLTGGALTIAEDTTLNGPGAKLLTINANGQPLTLPLPLADFGKAYDGPPTDPKVFEEQQKKLQEELQKRAEETRKKLEANPPAGAAAANPAAK